MTKPTKIWSRIKVYIYSYKLFLLIQMFSFHIIKIQKSYSSYLELLLFTGEDSPVVFVIYFETTSFLNTVMLE